MPAKKWVLALVVLVAFVFIGMTLNSFYRSHQWASQLQPTPELIVFAYSSFTSPYGPAAALKRTFEKRYDCKVKFVNAGDAGLLLRRMTLDKNTPVDVVLGLDQLHLNQARRQFSWHDLQAIQADIRWTPEIKDWVQERFIPYDWSPMTLIYRKGEISPPTSLKDLLKKEYHQSLSLQDPRSSTPGLQFLFWTYQTQPSLWPYWQSLFASVFSISPSWSSAYGLFKKGQAPMAFSYVTSLVYHRIQENQFNFQAASFEEGHPLQVEYMAISDRCRQCDLAKKWVQFLVGPSAQKIIMEKNYMLPVRKGVREGTEFGNLPQLKILKPTQLDSFLEKKEGLLKEWARLYRNAESQNTE